MAEARSAGVRKEERLAVGLDTAGIVAATRSSEIASTWRVYVRTWVFDSRWSTLEDANAHYEKTYSGRLIDGGWTVSEDPEDGTWVLWVHTWTVDSEWKRENFARAWATAIVTERGIVPEDNVEVVERNSRREHVLASYGLMKLA